MARIESEIVIGRPVDVVFDLSLTSATSRGINRRMVWAEKITVGALGKGSRFRPVVASVGHG